MSAPTYNWTSVGPGGCDSHCIEHPCGPCAIEAGILSQTDGMILRQQAKIRRQIAEAVAVPAEALGITPTPAEKRLFQMQQADAEIDSPRETGCPAHARQPDIDICRECGDHAHFEEEGGRLYSECCSAPPYDPDC